MTNEEFEAVRFIYKVDFIGLYDADTIDVFARHGLGIYSKHNKKTGRIRLLDIDAWELRGEERPLGIIARDALAAKIVGKTGWIKTHLDTTGKYGRYLAEVWIDGVCINKWLVDEGHATVYGETRETV